jgi:hypothetical protein
VNTQTRLSRKQLAANATRERMRCAAQRAAEDPVVLAKAARIVQAGIESGKLTPSDLAGPIVLTLSDLAGPAVPPQASP